MKKLLYFFLACTAILSHTSNTAYARPLFKHSIRAGVNISTLKGMNDPKFKYSPYLGYSLDIDVSKNPNLSFLAGADLSIQGAKFDMFGSDLYNISVSEKGKINLAYLNFPLLVQYKIKFIHLKAGLQFGILLNSKLAYDTYRSNAPGSAGNKIKDLNSLDLTIPLGIGLMVTDKIGVELRYNIGVTGIGNYVSGDPKNRVIQLGMLLSF